MMAELIPLASPRGALARHVIFVHGLGGDPRGTWTSPPPPQNRVWPEWLAEDVEGLAVWSAGYEASVSNWRGSAMDLADRAQNVLSLLLVKPELQKGELIFVGHSLGGLVIKQVLRKAADAAAARADAYSLVDRTRRVAFLATPHSGADLAGLGDRLRVIFRPSAATRSLLRNDSHLRDLNIWYRDWTRQREIDHLILFETKTTSVFGMIVKPDSSDPGLSANPVPIDADHITIAKPPNRENQIYALIRDFIERRVERTVSREESKIDDVKDDTHAIRLAVADGPRFALLEVVLNREQPTNVSIQPARDTSSDSMSLVVKLAESFGYPSYAWMTKSLAKFYERAWGEPLGFEFPQDHLDWLRWDEWDLLYRKIGSYEDSWIWEVMRWYAAANTTVRNWHRLETITARSATINLTIKNIGSKPATRTVAEAKIYADNKQQLHYADNFTYGDDKIDTFGNNHEYDSDWYIDLFRSRCELTDKKDIRDFQILNSSNEVININKPVWYGEPQLRFKVYDFIGKFAASIKSTDSDQVLQFRCEIPDEIVHGDAVDCPGFHVNFFYQEIKNLTIEYRVHSRDQEKPTTGKIVIDIVEFEPISRGSEPWIDPTRPLKYGQFEVLRR